MASKVFALFELRQKIFEELKKMNFKKVRDNFEKKYKCIPKIVHNVDIGFPGYTSTVDICIANTSKYYRYEYCNILSWYICYLYQTVENENLPNRLEQYWWNLDRNRYVKTTER